MTRRRRLDRRSNPTIEPWPDGTEPLGAAVFVHNERVIRADRSALWSLLVHAEDWPRWYPNARRVRILGGDTRLSDGAAFEWRTFGVAVRSQVADFTFPRRLGWLWWAPGLYGYHGWRLDEHPLGSRVVTEETQRGPKARRLAIALTGALTIGHSVWLSRLSAQFPAREPGTQG